MILRYLLRRLYLLSFVFIALTLFTFSLNYVAPGELVTNFSGITQPTDEQRAELSKQLGLDQNIVSQYILYVQRLVQGNWGLSFSSHQPVIYDVMSVLPATIELASYALIISLAVGIPLGLLAAIRQDRWLDRLISAFARVGFSLPIFWWALLLIMLFSLQLGWLPTSGRLSVLYEVPRQTGFILYDIFIADIPYRHAAFEDALQHLLLPSLILATNPTTVMIRFVRDSMMQVLEQAYVKTARAKGLRRGQVLYHHGLRNALLPVTHQVGLQFSSLITLAMLTEVIFSWPGIGQWLIASIYQRDFIAIQAGVLVISSLVVTVNMLTEILHTLLNPLARKS